MSTALLLQAQEASAMQAVCTNWRLFVALAQSPVTQANAFLQRSLLCTDFHYLKIPPKEVWEILKVTLIAFLK
jgi:hypothetical protein